MDTLVVKEVMTSEVITTTPDTLLADAAQVLVERKIGCLPVIEAGRLLGIITEGDFVALATRKD
jgi:CBS domain-containing membrane protein